MQQSGIPEHFDTINIGIDFDSNPNVLTELEHGKQLKQMFVRKALPIFITSLFILKSVALLVFLNEKFKHLTGIENMFGKHNSALMAGIKNSSVFKINGNKTLFQWTFAVAIQFLVMGITLLIMILISTNKESFDDFGEDQ